MSDVRRIAKEILDGDLGILQGARKMVFAYHQLGLDDPVFNVFRALDSETDNLLLEPINFPISDERRANNMSEIESIEAFYRDDILSTCRQLTGENQNS
jgi:hypothetical protein